MGLCRCVNDYVIEKIREYPTRLVGYISVVPNHRDAEKEIDRCFAAGLRGVGELFPEGQNFRMEEAEDTDALVHACRERGLPVLIHVNEPVGHYYAGKTNTTLRQTERFIENSPGLTIILAHWGGGFLFYEAMPEVRKKCADVYYDNAAAVFLYDRRIYQAACALGLRKKLLFGSDFPLLSPGRYMAGIDGSGIPPRDRELLLGGNAEELLKRTGAWTER
jgi:predicted TIM-barrel fold metal-dependent hydrolase